MDYIDPTPRSAFGEIWRNCCPKAVILVASGRRRSGPKLDWNLACQNSNLVSVGPRKARLRTDDLQGLGVGFVSLNEGIDATTAAGRLQMAVLAGQSQPLKEIASLNVSGPV